MFALSKPTMREVDALAGSLKHANFSYPSAGASSTSGAAAGFVVDHNRKIVGQGEVAFSLGVEAIKNLVMFPAPWIEVYPNKIACRSGEIIAVLARGLGIWAINFSRIVYTIDERQPEALLWRFGFAYGTLPIHIEAGEERFLVEWDRTSDQVTYDLFAFSRPRHLLAKLGHPYVRALQHRFQRLSVAAMEKVCRSTDD